MADFQDLIKQRESFSDESQTALMKKVAALQSGLWSELLEKVISELETNADGRILFNSANVQKVGRASLVWAAYRKQMGGVTDWIVKQLLKLFGLNSAYAREVGKLSDTVESRARKLLLENLGYDLDKKQVIKDSWLDNLAAQDEVKQKIMNRLGAAIQGGLDLKGFKDTFKNDFLDTQTGLGLATKNMDFHAHNLFQSFDRATQATYREKLGLNWGIYSGTLMKATKKTRGTRSFCIERISNIYSVAEVEKWNKLDWAGKIEGSDIKVTAGGYRCRHHISWISDEMKETLEGRGRKVDEYTELPPGRSLKN
jgi:hypothetical protein